jgi:hypothetical protein
LCCLLAGVRYDTPMKSNPDSDTTPAQKYRKFEDGLRKILTVSKTELLKREKEYRDSRPAHLRRGPKPKNASGRVSNVQD